MWSASAHLGVKRVPCVGEFGRRRGPSCSPPHNDLAETGEHCLRCASGKPAGARDSRSASGRTSTGGGRFHGVRNVGPGEGPPPLGIGELGVAGRHEWSAVAQGSYQRGSGNPGRRRRESEVVAQPMASLPWQGSLGFALWAETRRPLGQDPHRQKANGGWATEGAGSWPEHGWLPLLNPGGFRTWTIGRAHPFKRRGFS